jgi:cellulose synthase (UDP-forming)
VLKGEKIKFPVTPKDRQEGNFLHLVTPQLTVVALTLLGIVYSAYRVFGAGRLDETPSFIVNTFWGLNNVMCMLPMVRAALWKPEDEPQEAPQSDTPTDAGRTRPATVLVAPQ